MERRGRRRVSRLAQWGTETYSRHKIAVRQAPNLPRSWRSLFSRAAEKASLADAAGRWYTIGSGTFCLHGKTQDVPTWRRQCPASSDAASSRMRRRNVKSLSDEEAQLGSVFFTTMCSNISLRQDKHGASIVVSSD